MRFLSSALIPSLWFPVLFSISSHEIHVLCSILSHLLLVLNSNLLTLIPCLLLCLFHWNSCLCPIPSHLHTCPEIYYLNFIPVSALRKLPPLTFTFLSSDLSPNIDSYPLLYPWLWDSCPLLHPITVHSSPVSYPLTLIPSLCSIPHIDIPVLCSISSHLHACPMVCRNSHLVSPVSWSIPSIDACLHWAVF